MNEKRYKSIGANLNCSNGMEYMLIKRNDGFNVCQVCSKYTAKEIVDELNSLAEENEQLKQSIKEIDDAELHLKQILLKRIDDYIWEWEDEGTPVAQVLRELRDEIKGDVE